jgi:hypothetical protein
MLLFLALCLDGTVKFTNNTGDAGFSLTYSDDKKIRKHAYITYNGALCCIAVIDDGSCNVLPYIRDHDPCSYILTVNVVGENVEFILNKRENTKQDIRPDDGVFNYFTIDKTTKSHYILPFELRYNKIQNYECGFELNELYVSACQLHYYLSDSSGYPYCMMQTKNGDLVVSNGDIKVEYFKLSYDNKNGVSIVAITQEDLQKEGIEEQNGEIIFFFVNSKNKLQPFVIEYVGDGKFSLPRFSGDSVSFIPLCKGLYQTLPAAGSCSPLKHRQPGLIRRILNAMKYYWESSKAFFARLNCFNWQK